MNQTEIPKDIRHLAEAYAHRFAVHGRGMSEEWLRQFVQAILESPELNPKELIMFPFGQVEVITDASSYVQTASGNEAE